MPLLWILLYYLIDQDLRESEPREDKCPRRRRPLGRGLEPRPPWCVIDPVHDRRLKTLSEEEIAEKRKAEEEWLTIVKRVKRTLTVVAWSVLTVAVVYFAYVRPLVFPDTYRVWLSLPKLGDFDPDSIRGFTSSTLWFVLDMMIFFLPIFLMFILMMSILKGWEEDELFEKR